MRQLNNWFSEWQIILQSPFLCKPSPCTGWTALKQPWISEPSQWSTHYSSCMLLAQYLLCNPLIIMILIIMATGRNQYTDGKECNDRKRINDESQGFISWHCTGSKAVSINLQESYVTRDNSLLILLTCLTSTHLGRDDSATSCCTGPQL